jgi:hypothetical protein
VRQGLELPAALDEDAAPGGLGHAGDEGGWCCQDQRAGGCRNQHGEAADRVAGEEPSGTCQGKRDPQQQQGIAVGQSDKRSLGALARCHHADDAGIGALAGGGCGAQLERLAGIERAAPRRLTGPAADRDGLPRQRRLVDQGLNARDHPIDGDDLARAHEHLLTDRNVLDRSILDGAPDAAVCHPWCPVGERLQVALGPGDGIVLQHRAAGIHDSDDRACQSLAERQGGHHGVRRRRRPRARPVGRVPLRPARRRSRAMCRRPIATARRCSSPPTRRSRRVPVLRAPRRSGLAERVALCFPSATMSLRSHESYSKGEGLIFGRTTLTADRRFDRHQEHSPVLWTILGDANRIVAQHIVAHECEEALLIRALCQVFSACWCPSCGPVWTTAIASPLRRNDGRRASQAPAVVTASPSREFRRSA